MTEKKPDWTSALTELEQDYNEKHPSGNPAENTITGGVDLLRPTTPEELAAWEDFYGDMSMYPRDFYGY